MLSLNPQLNEGQTKLSKGPLGLIQRIDFIPRCGENSRRSSWASAHGFENQRGLISEVVDIRELRASCKVFRSNRGDTGNGIYVYICRESYSNIRRVSLYFSSNAL